MPSTPLKKIVFILSLILFLGAAGMIVYAIALGPEANTGGYWFSFGDVIIQFVVAILGLGGLSFTFFADRKEENSPLESAIVNKTKINSDGGSVFTGNLAAKKDFVVGDKIVHHHYSPVIEVDTDPEALWERFREIPTDVVSDRGGIPAGSYFNMSVNPDFVGRQNQLTQLAQMISQEGNVSTVAIAATGLGGIGKTQLAAAFCHRYGRYFGGGVFWLNFESEETARTDLAQVAILLNEAWQSLTIDEQITMVLNHPDGWSANIPRLLVFDNLEDVKLLKKHKPARGGCRLLLTSRRGNWERAGIDGLDTLPLEILDRTESIALIQKLAEHVNQPDADAIAAELGDLPLALHVAGAYLSFFANSVLVETYIGDLEAFSVMGQLGQQAADIEEESVTPTDHTWHIGRTFRLSYDQLLDKGDSADDQDPTNPKWIARRLLSRAAVFAPGTPIPLDMLYESFEMGEDDKQAAPDKKVLQKGISLLMRLGLLDRALFMKEPGVMIHRLIIDFVRAIGRQSEEDVFESRNALWIRSKRLNYAGFPRELLPYHPHLYHLLDTAPVAKDVQIASLLSTIAFNLQEMGDLAGAKSYSEQALDIHRETLGEKHTDTAWSLINLGFLLQKMGDFAGAKLYFEQALDIQRELLGEKHPDTVIFLKNLGSLLQGMDDFAGAKPYYQQALDIQREALGDKHPDTARSLDNLGSLLQRMDDFAGAKLYFEQALDIYEKTVGDQSPDIAWPLSSMGSLLQKMGDLAGAKPYYEQALDITRKALGETHPGTVIFLKNLGSLLRRMDDFAGAKPYYQQALDIRKKVLGDQHPDTAQSLRDMGDLLRGIGNLAEVKFYYGQALDICNKTLGDQHPDTAYTLARLGYLMSDMNDLSSAKTYFEQSLKIYRNILGDSHQDTAFALTSLGHLLAQMNDLAGAKNSFEQALEIRRKVFGNQHLSTARSLSHLGLVFQGMGDLDRAKPYYQQALAVLEEKLGADHPDTLIARQGLEALG